MSRIRADIEIHDIPETRILAYDVMKKLGSTAHCFGA
jgi:hypothetical protein